MEEDLEVVVVIDILKSVQQPPMVQMVTPCGTEKRAVEVGDCLMCHLSVATISVSMLLQWSVAFMCS